MNITELTRMQRIEALRNSGVVIPCSDGIIISEDALIGEGTLILPGTIIKEGCVIGKGCTIGPNTVLHKTKSADGCELNCVYAEEAEIGSHVKAGPFVHLRPGTVLSEGVHCGNFVEVKNSSVGSNTKISHLTYVGDSDVGNNVNFGCGTVTVNFNGKTKNRCKIGNNAFIGCNTNLLAPIKIGDRAYTAAGSTITQDVPDDALAIARERQTNKINWVIDRKPYK